MSNISVSGEHLPPRQRKSAWSIYLSLERYAETLVSFPVHTSVFWAWHPQPIFSGATKVTRDKSKPIAQQGVKPRRAQFSRNQADSAKGNLCPDLSLKQELKKC